MTKKGKKVIIIDDDEIFLETLANVLKLSDLDVYQEKTAESGFEAIVNIEPDLVLLDIVMPVMNGFEVLKNRQENASL